MHHRGHRVGIQQPLLQGTQIRNQRVQSARGTAKPKRLGFAQEQLFVLARQCRGNDSLRSKSSPECPSPVRRVVEYDCHAALLTVGIAARDRCVGVGTGAAAVHHFQGVAGGKRAYQPDVSGHVERLTVHGYDEVTSPDRRRLGAIATEGSGLDADNHHALGVRAQGQARVRGLPRRRLGRQRCRRGGPIGAQPVAFDWLPREGCGGIRGLGPSMADPAERSGYEEQESQGKLHAMASRWIISHTNGCRLATSWDLSRPCAAERSGWRAPQALRSKTDGARPK